MRGNSIEFIQDTERKYHSQLLIQLQPISVSYMNSKDIGLVTFAQRCHDLTRRQVS